MFLDKMIDWVKKKKIWVVIIIIASFIFPILVTHILFKWKTDNYFFYAEWSAGDVLSYIASFEAFLGTLILGFIAIFQSKKANDINKRLFQMQWELQRFHIKDKAAPFKINILDIDGKYVVPDASYHEKFDFFNKEYLYFHFYRCKESMGKDSSTYNMVFEIENISDVVSKELYLDDLKLNNFITYENSLSETDPEYNYIKSSYGSGFILKPGEKKMICIKISIGELDLSEESFDGYFTISSMSIHNVIFTQDVAIYRRTTMGEEDYVEIRTDRNRFINMQEAVDEKEYYDYFNTGE